MKLFDQYRGLRRENYILFFARIVTNMGSMVYPVMTLILNQKLGLNATQVALVTILSGFVMLPANIVGGKLADKFNKKNILIICDLCSVVLFITCGLIPLSMTTIVIMVFAGMFQTMENPVFMALLADITYTKNRDKAYSLSYLGMNLGLVASPTIAGILFENYLWLSFIISGFAILCSTIMIFIFVKDISPVEETSAETEYQASREGESLFTILWENKVILVFTLIVTLYWAAYSEYSYIIPLELGRIHGENGALLYGSICSINCIIVVIFTPIFTKLFSNTKDIKKMLLGQLLVLIGFISFLLFLGNVPSYYAAMGLFTFGEILATISNGPYIASRIPSSHRGRVNGFIDFAHNFFYGVIMIIIARLYDEISSTSAWFVLFVILGISIAVNIILMPFDKKKYANLYEE